MTFDQGQEFEPINTVNYRGIQIDKSAQPIDKPFYKTQSFWLEVLKVVASAAATAGVAYLANKKK